MLKTAQALKDIPEDLIKLIEKNFPNVNFKSYFFTKYIQPPLVNWLELADQVWAHYSLFEYDFIANGQRIKAGKPELNIVIPEFVRYCLTQKLNYAQINAQKQLTDLVFQQAQERGYAFLFTWPNQISQNTYLKNGYQVKPVKLSLYRRPVKFTWPWSLKLEKTIEFDFDIEKLWNELNQNKAIYVYKNTAIINKKFQENYFDKYIIRHKQKIIGYVVLKRDGGLLKLVDYAVADKYFYQMLAALPSGHILYRDYNAKANWLKIFNLGFIGYRQIERKFNYYLFEKNIDLNQLALTDYLSDFSV